MICKIRSVPTFPKTSWIWIIISSWNKWAP
jgi:hypothetical protein